MNKKFHFPAKGFYYVERKVKEADYFLDKLAEKKGSYEEFSYILSAFTSAARSITFSLQSVMTHYPNFKSWYEPRQKQLKENKLAKYFIDLRNHMQKVGGSPVVHAGTMKNGEIKHHALFMPTDDFKNTPPGGVVQLAKEYYIDILRIIKQCYEDFSEYVDPRVIFTIEGLSKLGWTIEDLEESCDLPRGWTDIDEDIPNKTQERLNLLKREYQKEEEMEFYFKKYNVK